VKGTKTEIRPGVWRLRVYTGRRANGSPIQIAKTLELGDGKPGSGSRLADRELANMVAKYGNGTAPTDNATVDELLDRFLAHRKSRLSPTTIRAYVSVADTWIRPELGKVKLSRLTAMHLDGLYTNMTDAGKTPATVRRAHALMSSALVQGRKWRLVESNVAIDASPPPAAEVRLKVPTPDQVTAIIEAAEEIEPTMASLLFIAAVTGARRGELCGLRWTDLDEKAGTLTIARSVYETREGAGWAVKDPKTRQVRRIALDKASLEVLRRERKNRDGLARKLGVVTLADGFIFSRSPIGAEPIGPDAVTRFAKRAAAKAGVETHLHALRHFSATQAIAAGFDPVTVGGRLGHADTSMTLRVYSHALEQRDRDLADTLGRALTPPAPRRRHDPSVGSK
jgi:integrase